MVNLEPAEPVVLDERGDVAVFASIRDLVGYVEATDVRDGIYRAFDASGRPILLAAASDRARVTYTVGPHADPGHLRDILVRFAKRSNVVSTLSPKIELDLASLEALLDALVPRKNRSEVGSPGDQGVSGNG
jgi:hypothetical protein